MTGINPNLSSYYGANFNPKTPSPTSAASLGKEHLESHFPQHVNSPQETYSRTFVVELDGKRYALTGKPTYTQNAQGTFDLTDIKYSYKEIGQDEEVQYRGIDENVVWCCGDSPSQDPEPSVKPKGLTMEERFNASNLINKRPNLIETFRKDLGLK